MNRKTLILICLSLFAFNLNAQNTNLVDIRFMVSQTLMIYAQSDSAITEYPMQIIQTSDSIKLINFCFIDTVYASSTEDSILIPKQVFGTPSDNYYEIEGYGIYQNKILMFYIHSFNYRDYANSVLTCIPEETYYNNTFISNKKQWNIAYKWSEDGKNYIEPRRLYFNGFTNVNGTLYFNQYQDTPLPFDYEIQFNYFWRENAGKIFRLNQEGFEIMVFDTKLTTDETLVTDQEETFKVDSIGYYFYMNDSLRCWYLSSETRNRIWIQDIGDINESFLIASEHTDAKNELTCYFENNELIYQNPKYNDCIVMTSVDYQPEKQPRLIEFFKSGENLLQVNLQVKVNGKLEFFTTSGQRISTMSITENETVLCLPQNGLVIYKFTNIKSQTQTGKIFIQ